MSTADRLAGLWKAVWFFIGCGIISLPLVTVAGNVGARAPYVLAWVASLPVGAVCARPTFGAVQAGTLREGNWSALAIPVGGLAYFLAVVLGDEVSVLVVALVGGGGLGYGIALRYLLRRAARNEGAQSQ